MEDNNDIIMSSKQCMETLVKVVSRIVIGITLLILLCHLFDEEPEKTKVGNYWVNADYSIPVTQVKSLNHETREITYRPDGNYDKPIKIRDVEKINGLTHEELIEKMDLDYNDLSDYYGIEHR